MLRKIFISLPSLFGLLLLSGCTSKLLIHSEPSDAEVFISVVGKDEKKKIGMTPIELPESKIESELNIGSARAEFFQVIIQKKDFQTYKVMVPANRWGELVKVIKIKLDSGQDELRKAQGLIKFLLNSQKYVQIKQYEQAHMELDKSLEVDPNFSQAMMMKGAIFFLQKQYDLSAKWYKQAINTNPNSDEAIEMLKRIENIRSTGTENTGASQ